jgi:hypothetical protein
LNHFSAGSTLANTLMWSCLLVLTSTKTVIGPRTRCCQTAQLSTLLPLRSVLCGAVQIGSNVSALAFS